MPNTVVHSNTNSPVNKSMQQQIMKGQYMNGNLPGKANSRSNANSMQGSPIKHQKAMSMNISGGSSQAQGP
jgi:hypothetical protein